MRFTGCNKKIAPSHFFEFMTIFTAFFEIFNTKLTKLIKSELFSVRWDCTLITNNLLGGHFRIKGENLHIM